MQKTFRWNGLQNVSGMEQARSRWIICYRGSCCRGRIFSFMYWVGGLSRLTWCKFDSKWGALWEKQWFLHVEYQHMGHYNYSGLFHFSMPCPTAPSMHYRPIDVLYGCCSCCSAGGGGGGLQDVARCSRRVARGSRMDTYSLCQQSRVAAWSDIMFCGVPIVYCIWHAHFLCARWWHWRSVRNVSLKSSMLKWCYVCGVCIVILHLTCTVFVTKLMTLAQCAQCFVQIQHVEASHVLWCAHCVLLRKGCFYASGSTSFWSGAPERWIDFTRAGLI